MAGKFIFFFFSHFNMHSFGSSYGQCDYCKLHRVTGILQIQSPITGKILLVNVCDPCRLEAKRQGYAK